MCVEWNRSNGCICESNWLRVNRPKLEQAAVSSSDIFKQRSLSTFLPRRASAFSKYPQRSRSTNPPPPKSLARQFLLHHSYPSPLLSPRSPFLFLWIKVTDPFHPFLKQQEETAKSRRPSLSCLSFFSQKCKSPRETSSGFQVSRIKFPFKFSSIFSTEDKYVSHYVLIRISLNADGFCGEIFITKG